MFQPADGKYVVPMWTHRSQHESATRILRYRYLILLLNCGLLTLTMPFYDRTEDFA